MRGAAPVSLPVQGGRFSAAYRLPEPWVGQPHPPACGRLTSIPWIFQSPKPIPAYSEPAWGSRRLHPCPGTPLRVALNLN